MFGRKSVARAIALLLVFTLAACSKQTGTIAQSAGLLSLAGADYSVAQGAGSVTLMVNRNAGSIGAASVSYATANGSATSGSDYTAVNGTLNWVAGDSAPKPISVAISNATPFAGSKAFTVDLSAATGASMDSPSGATVTVTGKGSPGTITLASPTYSISQGNGVANVTISRTLGTAGTVSVDYATSDNTALAGTDYTAQSGTLTWNDGDAADKTVSIPISNATAFAGSKVFGIVLSNVRNATLGMQVSATITITGNSRPGTIAFASSSQAVAQNAGTVTIVVNRTGDTGGAATVSYASTSFNGSAVAGTDYTAVSGTLTWTTGDVTAKNISVPISNATPFIGAKTFSVGLSSASGASLGSPVSATITISGSGAPGTVALASATNAVGQAAGMVAITVNRSGGSAGAASISYTTSNGTAAAGSDYTATSGTLSWASGNSAAQTISVPISSATPFVGTKAFTLTIANATGVSLGTPASTQVTITGSGNPGTLAFSVGIASVGQGAGTITVAVNRGGGTTGAASVTYATANTGTAVAGTDYTATTGTLSWTNGDGAAKTFTVAISTATPFVGSKTFGMTLSSPAGANLGTTTTETVTVNGSGTAGNLAFATASYAAAQNGGSVTVTVNRNVGSVGAASINYATANGTASSGREYTAASGTLSWVSGDMTAQTVVIPLSNSTPFVGTRTFTVVLSGASGASLGTPSTTTVTITGSGVAGTVALSASAYAANQSAGTVTITVTRSGGSSGAASIAYGTSNGSAIAGADYTAASGTLNWAVGDSTAKSFAIPISTATGFTGTKSFTITLANASGASLGSPATAAVTITGSGVPGNVMLTWTAPTLNADGTTITELTGYKIHYGTDSTNLSRSVTISSATTTAAEITGLTTGLTYYFAISSITTSGGEGAPSNLAAQTI
jgi:hypothetical protein